MDFVDRLTALRQDKDYEQDVIAHVLGVQQSAVSKYERKAVNYKVEDIIKLAEFYNVSADYILGLPDDMPYPKR